VSYAQLAAALPGSGPELAPFVTAPVAALEEAIAAAFPECLGVAAKWMPADPPAAPAAPTAAPSRRGRRRRSAL